MRLLGVSTRDKKKVKDATLVDYLQFVDAVVEVHGDPFYELRYRCATAALCARTTTLTACVVQKPVSPDRLGRQRLAGG